MSEQEKPHDDLRCCDNGNLNEEHDCQKQPAPPVEEKAPSRPRLKLREAAAKSEETEPQGAGDPPMASRPGWTEVKPQPPATELTFLLDLLLNEKLSKSVKDKISSRIRVVEAKMQQPAAVQRAFVDQPHLAGGGGFPYQQQPPMGHGGTQGAGNPGIHAHLPPNPPDVNGPVPPQGNNTVIAQALASRQNAIARSFNHNDKPDPGRTGPRKF